jgi:hypothetical protein
LVHEPEGLAVEGQEVPEFMHLVGELSVLRLEVLQFRSEAILSELIHGGSRSSICSHINK